MPLKHIQRLRDKRPENTSVRVVLIHRSDFLFGMRFFIKPGRNLEIDEFIVTDSVPLSDAMKATGKVTQLTLSGMLSEALRRVSNEESISAMFDY